VLVEEIDAPADRRKGARFTHNHPPGGCDWRRTRARHRRDERSSRGLGQLAILDNRFANCRCRLVGDWMALTRPRLVLDPARRPRSGADHDGAKHGDQRLMAAGAYLFGDPQHAFPHRGIHRITVPADATSFYEEQQRLGVRLETGGETTSSVTGKLDRQPSSWPRNTPEARRRQNRPRVWDRTSLWPLHEPL
jgi:hypothetical protein